MSNGSQSDVPPSPRNGFVRTFPSSSDDNDDEAEPTAAVTKPVSSGNPTASTGKRSTRPPTTRPSAKRAPKLGLPKGKKPRGENFTLVEVFSFLDTVREVLPLGTTDWEIVARVHHQGWPERDRSAMSLKNKYAKLLHAKASTGEPYIAPENLLALEIHEMIKVKAEITTTDTPPWRMCGGQCGRGGRWARERRSCCGTFRL